MIQRIHAPISVDLVFDHTLRKVFPRFVRWEGQSHRILKIGLHHTYRQGRTLYHVFSVETATLFFRLVLDTDTLHWSVEEIADGESN
jgi:hypothetical protein